MVMNRCSVSYLNGVWCELFGIFSVVISYSYMPSTKTDKFGKGKVNILQQQEISLKEKLVCDYMEPIYSQLLTEKEVLKPKGKKSQQCSACWCVEDEALLQ